MNKLLKQRKNQHYKIKTKSKIIKNKRGGSKLNKKRKSKLNKKRVGGSAPSELKYRCECTYRTQEAAKKTKTPKKTIKYGDLWMRSFDYGRLSVKFAILDTEFFQIDHLYSNYSTNYTKKIRLTDIHSLQKINDVGFEVMWNQIGAGAAEEMCSIKLEAKDKNEREAWFESLCNVLNKFHKPYHVIQQKIQDISKTQDADNKKGRSKQDLKEAVKRKKILDDWIANRNIIKYSLDVNDKFSLMHDVILSDKFLTIHRIYNNFTLNYTIIIDLMDIRSLKKIKDNGVSVIWEQSDKDNLTIKDSFTFYWLQNDAGNRDDWLESLIKALHINNSYTVINQASEEKALPAPLTDEKKWMLDLAIKIYLEDRSNRSILKERSEELNNRAEALGAMSADNRVEALAAMSADNRAQAKAAVERVATVNQKEAEEMQMEAVVAEPGEVAAGEATISQEDYPVLEELEARLNQATILLMEKEAKEEPERVKHAEEEVARAKATEEEVARAKATEKV